MLTFDDGFADVHRTALPLLEERRLPFTLYLATAYVGGRMHWDGSTASAPGPALTRAQLRELQASGLCTIGNHTHAHVWPERLTLTELHRCTAALEDHLGVTPASFAYPWGVRVAALEPELGARFRSAATRELGRNMPGCDPLRPATGPVRHTDPIDFFAAKLTGRLVPERAYAAIVSTAKRARPRG